MEKYEEIYQKISNELYDILPYQISQNLITADTSIPESFDLFYSSFRVEFINLVKSVIESNNFDIMVNLSVQTLAELYISDSGYKYLVELISNRHSID